MEAREERVNDSQPLLLVNGIAAIILGILLLVAPQITTSIIMVIFGIYLLISGAFSIMWIFSSQRKTSWGWLLAYGILGIIAGLVVLNHPAWTSLLALTLIVFILGIEAIVMGIIRIISAFQGEGWGTGIWGLILISFGTLLIINQQIAIALPEIIGAVAVAGGIILIIAYFTSLSHINHKVPISRMS
jgi:uncharacterized membrane protein HdeD (DUF308 family)